MVTTVLNVAEKPSVARALAGVFGHMPGAQDRGMQRREGAQVFTHERVQFPNIFMQGGGTRIQGPRKGNHS
jgi:DNA topoisomerase-3